MFPEATAKAISIIAVMFTLGLPAAYAQNSNMKLAYEAFDAGKAYKSQGDLARAQKMYEQVLSNAPADTNVYRRAQTEINFHLPLIQIQRLLWAGKTAAAEGKLLELQQKFDGQPLRRQEIGRILSGLKSNNDDASSAEGEIDEHLLIWRVKKALNDFYQVHKSYPLNGRALADVLSLNQPPLSAFTIWRYSSNGGGYLLVLRSKKDSHHTLTIQNTGLMQ